MLASDADAQLHMQLQQPGLSYLVVCFPIYLIVCASKQEPGVLLSYTPEGGSFCYVACMWHCSLRHDAAAPALVRPEHILRDRVRTLIEVFVCCCSLNSSHAGSEGQGAGLSCCPEQIKFQTWLGNAVPKCSRHTHGRIMSQMADLQR
jgi:hypothetical protein